MRSSFEVPPLSRREIQNRSTSNMSCEPRRASAYSKDLRFRMIWQREALGLTYSQIAANLGVDKSTVQRTVTLFKSTGSLKKRPYPKEKVRRKLSSLAENIHFEPCCSKARDIST